MVMMMVTPNLYLSLCCWLLYFLLIYILQAIFTLFCLVITILIIHDYVVVVVLLFARFFVSRFWDFSQNFWNMKFFLHFLISLFFFSMTLGFSNDDFNFQLHLPRILWYNFVILIIVNLIFYIRTKMRDENTKIDSCQSTPCQIQNLVTGNLTISTNSRAECCNL